MAETGVAARMRRHKWLAWVLGGLLLALVLYAAQRAWWSIGLTQYGAPPLSGVLLDGTEYRLQAQAVKPRLVYFWASWCPVCRAHKGTIDALMREHDVITVATKSGTGPEVRQHLDQAGLRWRTLNDPEGKLAQAWRAWGVPKMYVIDREGRVRFAVYGYTTGIGLRARLWFAENF